MKLTIGELETGKLTFGDLETGNGDGPCTYRGRARVIPIQRRSIFLAVTPSTVSSKRSRPWTRRTALKTVGAGSLLALAGCVGSGDDEGVDDTGDDDVDDTGDDDGADPDDLTSVDPAPSGDPISGNDIEGLIDVFDDQPMNDAQLEIDGSNREYTPRHVWKWVSDESFIGIHFDEPNPEEATAIDYVLVGRKGVFTDESRPDEEFSHFHQHTADSWDAGHGGETGAEGYWLTHIAAREIEYPFHEEPIGPRVDYGFNPTPPEEGSTGHTTDFQSPDGDEGSLSADDRDALLEIFDDRPFNDAQFEVDGEFTPRHAWLWLTEDVLAFLHFDEPNPAEATELDYFGIGVRGQFDADSVPAGQSEAFTHFHKHEADGWEAGHGAQSADQYGYWLVHHTVREVEYPFHDTPADIGVDREFMPTPPDDSG